MHRLHVPGLKLPAMMWLLVVLLVVSACGAPAPAATQPTAVASTAAPAAPAAEPQVFRVLNWQGYGSDLPWVIEQFEKAHNVKVEHEYFSSLEEMLTKLRTSPGAYDAVLPNVAYLPAAIGENLVQPIDTAKLSNWQQLASRFQNLPEIRANDQIYGAPWTWGATAIAYNTEKISEPVTSINILWDPKYQGQVGWVDSAEDSMVLAAIAAGDPTPLQPTNMEAVQKKLEAAMPQIRTFWQTENEFNQLFQSGEITLGIFWSGSALNSIQTLNLPMKFVIPDEGAVGWIDTWAIPQGSKQADLAHAWIDLMISADFYTRWANEGGSAPVSTNTKALEQLPADAFNRAVMGDPKVAERLQFLSAVPDATRQEWTRIWETVKTK
jgi:spermidine/putrescine transport system substrate-binding protein